MSNTEQQKSEKMFERALRLGLTIPTPKGEISLEQLWQAPLESRNGFDLDAIAGKIDTDLKAQPATSFTRKEKKPQQVKLELAFEIVQYVIQVKLDEEAKAKAQADNKVQLEKIKEALKKREDATLDNMSAEELHKLHKSLSGNS